jgi:hypothetical protein
MTPRPPLTTGRRAAEIPRALRDSATAICDPPVGNSPALTDLNAGFSRARGTYLSALVLQYRAWRSPCNQHAYPQPPPFVSQH